MKSWFANWFDTEYYHILYQHRDYAEAERFMGNFLKKWNPKPGDMVLDLACGKGRHSIFLAGKGLTVTGVDLSANSIREAQKHEAPNLDFYVHDMRRMSWIRNFDAVCCLFTSFGYFETDGEHLATLRNVKTALKPGGLFVLDFINPAKFIPYFPHEETKILNDIKFELHKQVLNGFIVKDIRFEDKGQAFHFQEKVRAFTLSELKEMLTKSGFEHVQVYGNYDFGPYDELHSDRMIFECR